MVSSEHRNDQHPEFGEAVRLGHEPLTISIKGLVIGTAGILLLVGASLVLMYWLAIGLESRDTVSAREVPLEWTQEDLPPQPHVQPNHHYELEQLTRANEKLLESYGWIDKQQGVARIPVDRAIELLSERGSPTLRLSSASPARNGSAPEETSSAETER